MKANHPFCEGLTEQVQRRKAKTREEAEIRKNLKITKKVIEENNPNPKIFFSNNKQFNSQQQMMR